MNGNQDNVNMCQPSRAGVRQELFVAYVYTRNVGATAAFNSVCYS